MADSKKAGRKASYQFQGRKRERTGGRSKGGDFSRSVTFGDKKLDKAYADKKKARKKYNKARAGAQKTTYSMQRVLDEKTGTYSYKLVADKQDLKPDKVTRKKQGRKFMYEAAAIASAKGKEGQDDNDATNAATATEQTGERLFDFVQEHSKSPTQRKYDRLAKAQKKLEKTETVFDKRKFQFETKQTYEKWLKENPGMNEKSVSNTMKKQIQKVRIKRQYQKAARAAKTAERTAEATVEAAKTSTLVAHKMQEFVERNWRIMFSVGALALLLIVIMSMFTSCAAMFGSSVSTTMASTYLSDPDDIDAADLQMTELEMSLQEEINNIETDYPDYDEYDYNLGEIGHNPSALISYLSAKYTEFTAEGVKAEIKALFSELYKLTLTPDTEIRTRTVTRTSTYTDPETGETTVEQYEEEEEYEVSILRVKLTVKSIEEIANMNLTAEQKEMYAVYMETKGALQIFASPVDYYWYDYISSYYGYRISPTTGEKEFHRGLDIAVPEGTTVYATHDGTIAEAGYNDTFGNYVVITDSQGYTTKYGHLSSINVTAGQTVKKGKIIGKTGSTGSSTGSHLHLECLYNGEYYNPLFYFNCGTKTMYGESSGGSGGMDYELPDSFDDAQVEALLKEANKYVGTPYVWGGSSPSTGFDCSGFVCWSFKASGTYPLERTTAQGIYNKCAKVTPGEEQPGDIIFFTGTYNSGNPVTHVGIVVSPGIMVHAGDPIKYSSYTTSYWQSHFYAFGRLAN
jgi:murein DD-endopeptidase MepM/ murein hydrolase activator NlpD